MILNFDNRVACLISKTPEGLSRQAGTQRNEVRLLFLLSGACPAASRISIFSDEISETKKSIKSESLRICVFIPSGTEDRFSIRERQGRVGFQLSAVVRVADLMSRQVICVDITSTVFEAVSKLIEHDVGCVLVIKGKDLVGIVTKGDILRKAVLKGLDPSATPVEKVMSYNVATIGKYESVEEASRLMSKRKVSKLPVLEEGKLVGIITSTDIIRTEPFLVDYLHELIRARFVPHELA